jgi:AraC-like DNA-binding protein
MDGQSSTHVKDYVVVHLPTIHSIRDVARELGMSSHTLRKDFMRAERISLRDFIASRRLEKMQELLTGTELSCMAICLELGCREDAGERFFKKSTGMTMNQHRLLFGNRAETPAPDGSPAVPGCAK